LGKNQGRFGELFFGYLWLSSFQEGKFRIAGSDVQLLILYGPIILKKQDYSKLMNKHPE
jgi:hypothetical protein